MRKLIEGIVSFRKSLNEEHRALFSQLASGHKPDTLFIACCDSRVVPNLFASTDPGDLFVVRNVGNMVPPSGAGIEDNSVIAALEFSLFNLKVNDIVLCGHSECGAMQALLDSYNCPTCSHLSSWLRHGKPSLERIEKGDSVNRQIAKHNQLSQINVLQQIEHIKSYPFIKPLLKEKKIRLHAWWFDIAHADVYCYEEGERGFVLIDEKEAEIILQRLG